jgi:hypothetical protein
MKNEKLNYYRSDRISAKNIVDASQIKATLYLFHWMQSYVEQAVAAGY